MRFASAFLPLRPQAEPASVPNERFRSGLGFVAVPLRFVAIIGEGRVLVAFVSLFLVFVPARACRLRPRVFWPVVSRLALSVIGLGSGAL